MAKQHVAFITGTIEDLTFYQLEGKYYVRRKSSLSGKRVKSDPAFSRTMQNANRLGMASQVASYYYRRLPKEEQVYQLFVALRSIGIKALKEGKGEEELHVILQQYIEKMGLSFVEGTVADKKEKDEKKGVVQISKGCLSKGPVVAPAPKVFALPRSWKKVKKGRKKNSRNRMLRRRSKELQIATRDYDYGLWHLQISPCGRNERAMIITEKKILLE